jgi:hypothetical protein
MKTYKLLPLLLAAVVLVLILMPSRATGAAPVITGVEPRTVSNLSSTNLVVTGSGFGSDAGAVVVLDGYGALATTMVTTDTMLMAALPAGAAPGQYKVKVIVPGNGTALWNGTVTVTGPAAPATPTDIPAPTQFQRPLLVVQSYGASSAEVASNQNYDFEMTLQNAGQGTATNIVATFVSGDFTPRATGGVRAIGALGAGETARFFQPLTSGSLADKTIATLEVKIAYTDPNGVTYADTFTLTFPVAKPVIGPARATSTPTPTPTPTATAKPAPRPQLLVASYNTDVVNLQPGGRFALNLNVRNVGNTQAKRVTVIIGGGSTSNGSGSGGTPQPGSGGISGGSGDLSNFAPLNSSNIQYLGDLQVDAVAAVQQVLIVNATTKPGAYTLKLSFTYTDEKSDAYTDDQVITLLVYQPPLVNIGFYRESGPLMSGQPNPLPLQVVNLGRSSTVFGNMKVMASSDEAGGGAQFSNNSTLVGALDPGGFFTLDALVTPNQAGPLRILVTIDYTDDFNQPQIITQTLEVEVLEGASVGPIPEGPGGPAGPIEPTPAPETLWDQVKRLVLGLLGLDSATPANPAGPGVELTPLPGKPIIVPAPGKG